jgi:hypothetical protein
VILLKVNLFVDGEKIDLNEFVEEILSGTLEGAISSLRGIKKDWKTINLSLSK